MGDVETIGKDIATDYNDIETGDFNKSGSKSFELNAEHPNERENIFGDTE